MNSLRTLKARASHIFDESREAMRNSIILRLQCGFVKQQFITVHLSAAPDGIPLMTPRRSSLRPQLLSPRESEVLQLIAAGKTTRSIAAELKISFKTVATHRAHIMEKLEAANTAAVVREAYRLGLLKQ